MLLYTINASVLVLLTALMEHYPLIMPNCVRPNQFSTSIVGFTYPMGAHRLNSSMVTIQQGLGESEIALPNNPDYPRLLINPFAPVRHHLRRVV